MQNLQKFIVSTKEQAKNVRDVFGSDTEVELSPTKLDYILAVSNEGTKKLVEVQIPFGGFYDSWFTFSVDNHLECLQQWVDDSEDEDSAADEQAFIDTYPYDKARKAWVSAYLHELGTDLFCEDLIETPLILSAVVSPREYNFTTDRLYVFIEESFVIKTLSDREGLAVQAREWFTCRDGFASFYDPDIEEWNFNKLEAPQIFCAVDLLIRKSVENFDELEMYLEVEFP